MADYTLTLCLYHCLTPLHVGCGQDVGIVDLPVIRERTTGYPYVPGSGIRGTCRDKAEDRFGRNSPEVVTLFGPDSEEGDASEHSGCTAFHDAKMLFYPVRSNKGIFVYIACPYVLARLDRDLRFFFGNTPPISFPGALSAAMANLSDSDYVPVSPFAGGEWLEEFTFKKFDAISAKTSADLLKFCSSVVQKMGYAEDGPSYGWITQRVAVVCDGVFDYFVRNATLIVTHNKLTTAKTVAGGQLFSVESVPPETIFYGLFGVTKPRRPGSTMSVQKAQDTLREALTGSSTGTEGHLTLGGDESTGLGITRFSWVS